MQNRPEYSECEINQRRYSLNLGNGVAKRALSPGTRPSHDVHVTTPHPNPGMRRAGWRMAWIFLAGCFVCLLPVLVLAVH